MNWKSLQHWFLLLCSAVITGASTSFLSALGISGAELVGVKVAQLDLNQIGVVTLMGGLVGAAAYLKQSPLPTGE